MSAGAPNAPAQAMELVDEQNVNAAMAPQQPVKRKRKQAGSPAPNSVVVALSPETLLATNRFVCDICNKGFPRDQNLELHRRCHDLPWKLQQSDLSTGGRRQVYVCPEPTCIYHQPSRALSDITGIKKHYSRKHGERKLKCGKCSKCYAVMSDLKAHQKTCGTTREYKCECGTTFSRKDFLAAHQSYCDALTLESRRTGLGLSSSTVSTGEPDEAAAVFNCINIPTENNNQKFESLMRSDYCFETPQQDVEAAGQQDNNLSLWLIDNSFDLDAGPAAMVANAPNYTADASAGLDQFLPSASANFRNGSSSTFLNYGEGSLIPDSLQMPGTNLPPSSLPFTLSAANNIKAKGKEVAEPVGSMLTSYYNTNQGYYQASTPAAAKVSASALLPNAMPMVVTDSNPAESSMLAGLMSSSSASISAAFSLLGLITSPNSVYDQVERDLEFELFGHKRVRSFQEPIMGPYPSLETRAGRENNVCTTVIGVPQYNCDQPMGPPPVQQPELEEPSYLAGLGGSGNGRPDILAPELASRESSMTEDWWED